MYDSQTTDYGYVTGGTGETFMGAKSFNSGETANTIAHEEYHHESYKDTGKYGSEDYAHLIGSTCAEHVH